MISYIFTMCFRMLNACCATLHLVHWLMNDTKVFTLKSLDRKQVPNCPPPKVGCKIKIILWVVHFFVIEIETSAVICLLENLLRYKTEENLNNYCFIPQTAKLNLGGLKGSAYWPNWVVSSSFNVSCPKFESLQIKKLCLHLLQLYILYNKVL